MYRYTHISVTIQINSLYRHYIPLYHHTRCLVHLKPGLDDNKASLNSFQVSEL